MLPLTLWLLWCHLQIPSTDSWESQVTKKNSCHLKQKHYFLLETPLALNSSSHAVLHNDTWSFRRGPRQWQSHWPRSPHQDGESVLYSQSVTHSLANLFFSKPCEVGCKWAQDPCFTGQMLETRSSSLTMDWTPGTWQWKSPNCWTTGEVPKPHPLTCMYAWLLSHFSHVHLFATLRTIALQAPLSMARVLEWVAMPSSGGSSPPRDWTHDSCTAADTLSCEPPGKPLLTWPGLFPLDHCAFQKHCAENCGFTSPAFIWYDWDDLP